MAVLAFNSVGISAVYACVPKQIQPINSLSNIFSEETYSQKFTKSTGVKQRHIVTEGICSSDLCFEAAKRLLEENNISPD